MLPLQSQYILSLALFVIKNMEIFSPNSDIHTINTRNKSNLYPPQSRLTKYQKGVYFAGIKIFNHLPQKIKKLSGDTNKFRRNSKNFFYWAHSILLKNSSAWFPWVISVLCIYKHLLCTYWFETYKQIDYIIYRYYASVH